MDESAIRQRIRTMVETGALPCDEPEKVWAGKGMGQHCVACSQPISAAEIEYEVELTAGQMFRVHRRCHEIWREECEPLTARG